MPDRGGMNYNMREKSTGTSTAGSIIRSSGPAGQRLFQTLRVSIYLLGGQGAEERTRPQGIHDAMRNATSHAGIHNVGIADWRSRHYGTAGGLLDSFGEPEGRRWEAQPRAWQQSRSTIGFWLTKSRLAPHGVRSRGSLRDTRGPSGNRGRRISVDTGGRPPMERR